MIKPTKLNPQGIGYGDRCRIVDAHFVVRVGYPKAVDDYLPQVDAQIDKLNDFLMALRPDDKRHRVNLLHRSQHLPLPHPAWMGERVLNRIRQDTAYALARADGFGGTERTLHFKAIPELQGSLCTVWRARTVTTGIYYPPGGGGEDWCPGGLQNERRYRLVEIGYDGTVFFQADGTTGSLGRLELPLEHLELVTEA